MKCKPGCVELFILTRLADTIADDTEMILPLSIATDFKSHFLQYVHSLHAGLFFIIIMSSAVVVFKIIFFKKNSFRNTIIVSNSLDPDQA